MFRKLKRLISLADKLGDVEKRLAALNGFERRLVDVTANLKDLSKRFDPTRRDLDALKAQGRILNRDVESLKVLCGRIASETSRNLPPDAALREAEFQVFSQWGEDGIIQFLLGHVPIANEVFIEFGVQDYTECNTRFLLMNNLWSGLILDGSEPYMERVRQSPLTWRHTLHAKSAWITAENVNDLFTSSGISGDIGLLSVDIDGVDYWVWKAITAVQPRIVIAEYNSLFGPNLKVTPPYRPDYDRAAAHYSHLFYGPSLAAVEHLGKEKGFALVGTNTAGNNAFLVRRDLAAVFPERSAADVYQAARFREARLPSGGLAYPTFEEAQRLIEDCVVHDINSATERPLRELSDWR